MPARVSRDGFGPLRAANVDGHAVSPNNRALFDPNTASTIRHRTPREAYRYRRICKT
jgi:hypothetical protein